MMLSLLILSSRSVFCHHVRFNLDFSRCLTKTCISSIKHFFLPEILENRIRRARLASVLVLSTTYSLEGRLVQPWLGEKQPISPGALVTVGGRENDLALAGRAKLAASRQAFMAMEPGGAHLSRRGQAPVHSLA